MNQLRGCHLHTLQILRGHTRIFGRAYFLRPNNVFHMAWRTSAMLGQRVWDPLSLLHPSPNGADSDRATSSLLSRLRQKRWEEAVNSIDFSHSISKVWRTINKLTGRSGRSFHQCPISANSIVLQLVKNGAHKTGDRKSTRLVNKEFSDLWEIPTSEGHSISEPFRLEELAAALRRLKPGKSLGLDSIFLEFILPPKSYYPISLLCVSFKILERFIYTHVDPIINPLLPREQSGFRHRRSTIEQFTLLTQDIEDTFLAKKKARAVFVDLTAAYDTVWHHGLTCKLLQLPPDRHMVHMITEMVSNRSFNLTTGNSKRSRYNASRTASHRDRSWRPFSSTCTSLTCQPPSPESMHMLTI